MSDLKIVVVTQVKNEEWILERFLALTSRFADAIVVADQRSTDRSREIYAQFSKSHPIDRHESLLPEKRRGPSHGR